MSQLIQQCFEDGQGSKQKNQKRKQKTQLENRIIANTEQEKDKVQEDDFQLDNIEEILKKANKRTGLGFEENQAFGKITGGFRKNIQKAKYLEEKLAKDKQKKEDMLNNDDDIKFDSKNDSIRERKEPVLFFKAKKKIQKQKN